MPNMYIIARSLFISWTKFSLSKSEIGLDTHVIWKDGFHFFQNYSVQQKGWKVKEEMPATKHVMSFAPRKNLRWYCTLPGSSVKLFRTMVGRAWFSSGFSGRTKPRTGTYSQADTTRRFARIILHVS